MARKIEIVTRSYEIRHGRKPSRTVRGGWAFAIDGRRETADLLYCNGTLADCLKQARATATVSIEVMP